MQFLQLSLVISLRLTALMRVLKIFRVLDLLRSSLSLFQIVGPKYLIVCLPYVIVLNLGIVKSDFLRA